nr:uncharacterized protein LOC126526137 [Dermacentor andersoni]
MANTRDLLALAERMGLEGAELRARLNEQEERAREERAAEREERAAAREERAAEREAKRQELVLEEKNLQLRLKVAEAEGNRGETSQRQLELEERTLQLRLQMAATDAARTADRGPGGSAPFSVNPHSLMPGFNESRDDLDAYLKRFESVATGQEWPRDKWATALSLCLSGEALKVFGRLSPEDSLDYDKAKLALLQRFRFTAEGYRDTFRQSKPQDGETGKQYATRLLSFFDRWVEMSKTKKEYLALRNLVVTEQFLNNCHHRLGLFLREKSYRQLDDMAEAADNFLEAQRQPNLLVFRQKSEGSNPTEKTGSPSERVPMRCFVCGKLGHGASDCRSKQRQPYCGYCRKPEHDVKACTKKNDPPRTSCLLSPEERLEESNAVVVEQDVVSTVKTPTRNVARKMPVLKGFVFGQTASVLRDTGSNTLVVRRSLVPDKAMTGTTAKLVLADGSSIEIPEAKDTKESRERSIVFENPSTGQESKKQ